MTQAPLLALGHTARRLLFASLLYLPLAGACSDDEETAAPPVDLTLTITALDGSAPDASEPLRCDGTLAVQVDIAPATGFTLRPLHACGSSTRCGYLHVEALASDGELLTSVDSVTTLGLLKLKSGDLPRLAQITVVLLRGTDQMPVQNADLSEVSSSVDVDRPAPADCDTGSGGSSGLGGAPGSAGAPGQAGSDGVAGAPAGGAASGGSAMGGAAGASESTGGSADPNAGAGGI